MPPRSKTVLRRYARQVGLESWRDTREGYESAEPEVRALLTPTLETRAISHARAMAALGCSDEELNAPGVRTLVKDQASYVARRECRAYLAHAGHLTTIWQRMHDEFELENPDLAFDPDWPRISRDVELCQDLAEVNARVFVARLGGALIDDKPVEHWRAVGTDGIRSTILSLVDAHAFLAFSDEEWRAHKITILKAAGSGGAHQVTHELKVRGLL